MKKLLVVLAVLAMIVSGFAGASIATSGPNFTASLVSGGSVSFGLYFDENGLDLGNAISMKYSASFTIGLNVSASDSISYPATLTLGLSATAPGWNGTTWQGSIDKQLLSFNNGRYEDNLLNLYFKNGAYYGSWSKYTLFNEDANGDGKMDYTPVGRQYITTNFKPITLDALYITMSSATTYSPHATTNNATQLLFADFFAFKKTFDTDMAKLNAYAAFWAANKGSSSNKSRPATIEASSLTLDGKWLGGSAEAELTAKGILEGLTANFAAGANSKEKAADFKDFAYYAMVNYSKGYKVLETPSVTVTPHAKFQYNTLMNVLPFVKDTIAASWVNAGADLALDMGAVGTFGLKDTVTFAFGKDDGPNKNLKYYYGLTYTNKTLAFANVYGEFAKINGTEPATPFGLNVKLNGSYTMAPVTVSYLAEVAKVNKGGASKLVPLSDISKVTEKYFAYQATLKVDIIPSLVNLEAKVINYKTNSDGEYTNIYKIAEPVYYGTLAYTPNKFWKVAAHVGTDDGSSWGKFGNIHWNLSAVCSVSF